MKALTRAKLAASLVERGIVPSEALLQSRTGQLEWVSRGLRMQLNLDGQPSESLTWRLVVDDAEFGSVFVTELGMPIQVTPSVVFEWPRVASDENYYSLCQSVGRGIRLVGTRLELAEVLASSSDMEVDGLTVWLPASTYPGRLVRALVIAEDLGESILAAEVRTKIKAAPEVRGFGGKYESGRSVAERKARSLSARLLRTINI